MRSPSSACSWPRSCDDLSTRARGPGTAGVSAVADSVFREDDLQALHRMFGNLGRIRGLFAFLDQRGQLVTSSPRHLVTAAQRHRGAAAQRRRGDEAFVQRTIAALPPRISDEIGTWVGVLRGASRPHHRVTDYATLRRYLIYLAKPLADWTTRYTTLRQG